MVAQGGILAGRVGKLSSEGVGALSNHLMLGTPDYSRSKLPPRFSPSESLSPWGWEQGLRMKNFEK